MNKKWILVILLLPVGTVAQEEAAIQWEQQLEAITENEMETEEEPDRVWELADLRQHPLPLNTANAGMLVNSGLFSDLQAACFLRYREMAGALVSIYELQAVPCWDIAFIRFLLPYVSINDRSMKLSTLGQRFRKMTSNTLLRYAIRSVADKTAYPGSAAAIQIRHRYQHKNNLLLGFTAEKDPGETFFRGAQKKGFDFYSAHLFVRQLGFIKALAVGDFSVCFGQGLIQWQGMGVHKSAAVSLVKQQGPALKPYRTAGEYNFHRGLGMSLEKGSWEYTGFISYRKLSATVERDAVTGREWVSSVNRSGYHRTEAEQAGRGVLPVLTLGGRILITRPLWRLGINAVNYHYERTLLKDGQPYQLYAPRGKVFTNLSADYSITRGNLHFFGELASDQLGNLALLSGLLASLDSRFDFSCLYRNYSPAYQSAFSQAFGNNSAPANEKGLFAGLVFRAGRRWKLEGYIDLYKFPWLKYRVDWPSTGRDYLLHILYKPSRQLEMTYRLRATERPEGGIDNWTGRLQQRIQINWEINRQWNLRSRVETIRQVEGGRGVLAYTEWQYKPAGLSHSGNWRIELFEVPGYGQRIYSMESDVPFSSGFPAFYGSGFRWYLNYRLKLRRLKRILIKNNITISIKIAQTIEKKQETDDLLNHSGLWGQVWEGKLQIFLGS